ncbi:MAG TPA: PAC2 family protein [Chloroflexota bacterium]|nr:PAC2 family protein [Chloroflexota bacterium]
MPDEDVLHIESFPALRSPYFLAAFAGWNDAAQVATHALETLAEGWDADPFAEIDPEEFYDFSETRPTVSIEPSGMRALDWPSNIFYGHVTGAAHDVVLLIGVEPQLRWRTFARAIVDLAQRLNVRALITLGGLLADVPHTIEPRLTGFVLGGGDLPGLSDLGIRMSSYEGPTGIVGVLHDFWRETGQPAISLWGNVPHYISAAPNPGVALALLRRVETILGTPVPVGPLELQQGAFQTQVDAALSQNPEAAAYVQELEQAFRDDTPPPAGPDLIADLENFLRLRRPDDGE